MLYCLRVSYFPSPAGIVLLAFMVSEWLILARGERHWSNSRPLCGSGCGPFDDHDDKLIVLNGTGLSRFPVAAAVMDFLEHASRLDE